MKSIFLYSIFIIQATLSAQIVTIPDSEFKAALLFHDPVIDTNEDNEIQVSEAIAFSGYLNLSGFVFHDMTGIEAFVNITGLQCFGAVITTLDISHNTALETLSLPMSQITAIDITNNVALKELHLDNNQLNSLDISQNTDLEILKCGGNLLTALDVSQNTLLEELDCSSNLITELDVSQNLELKILKCNSNQINSLDVSSNLLLTELWCHFNNLNVLDIDQNEALEGLLVGFNQLSVLNVSQNPFLKVLGLSNNQVTTLDLTQNHNLTAVACDDNQVVFLDVRNGNNQNITMFHSENNPGLTCIFVDDINYSENHPHWEKDSTATYVETEVQCDALALYETSVGNDIYLYPNPVINNLIVNSSKMPILNVEIYNTNGKLVQSTTHNLKEISINVSGLEPGLYIARIKTGEEWFTQKLIKK